MANYRVNKGPLRSFYHFPGTVPEDATLSWNSAVKPPISLDKMIDEASTDICKNFLKFFISKIDNIRSPFPPPSSNMLPGCSGATDTLHQFQHMSFAEFRDLVKHMKPTSSPMMLSPPISSWMQLIQLAPAFK